MSIYISKNGQQSGPFDNDMVRGHLQRGELSAEDMGIRQGDSQWQKLGVLFPDAVPGIDPFNMPQPQADALPQQTAPAPVQYEAIYRGTTLQKAFFGLCLLVAVVALAGTAFYFYTLMGPSGDLQADLTKMSYRILARNAAGGILAGAFFTLLAFLFTFKRKLIRSNGPRIALRVIFILIMLVGLGNLAAGAVSYLDGRAAYKPVKSESNELLRAVEQGSEAIAPYETAVILVPIGAGLFLLGLSGVLMTKKLRTE